MPVKPPKCKTLIYGLCDPITGAVRYIGKTNNSLRRRLNGHTQRGRNRTCGCGEWVAGLVDAGLKPLIVCIEVVEDGKFWAAREAFWIEEYRRRGADLLNKSRGGSGPHGMAHTEELKERLRQKGIARYADPKERERVRQKCKEYWTPEARSAQSALVKKKMASPELRQRLSKVQSALTTPEKRHEMSARQRKYFSDPENRERMAQKTRDYFASPGAREKQSAISRARFSDPQMVERMKEIKSAQWRDPERKADMLKKRTATRERNRANADLSS